MTGAMFDFERELSLCRDQPDKLKSVLLRLSREMGVPELASLPLERPGVESWKCVVLKLLELYRAEQPENLSQSPEKRIALIERLGPILQTWNSRFRPSVKVDIKNCDTGVKRLQFAILGSSVNKLSSPKQDDCPPKLAASLIDGTLDLPVDVRKLEYCIDSDNYRLLLDSNFTAAVLSDHYSSLRCLSLTVTCLDDPTLEFWGLSEALYVKCTANDQQAILEALSRFISQFGNPNDCKIELNFKLLVRSESKSDFENLSFQARERVTSLYLTFERKAYFPPGFIELRELTFAKECLDSIHTEKWSESKVDPQFMKNFAAISGDLETLEIKDYQFSELILLQPLCLSKLKKLECYIGNLHSRKFGFLGLFTWKRRDSAMKCLAALTHLNLECLDLTLAFDHYLTNNVINWSEEFSRWKEISRDWSVKEFKLDCKMPTRHFLTLFGELPIKLSSLALHWDVAESVKPESWSAIYQILANPVCRELRELYMASTPSEFVHLKSWDGLEFDQLVSLTIHSAQPVTKSVDLVEKWFSWPCVTQIRSSVSQFNEALVSYDT